MIVGIGRDVNVVGRVEAVLRRRPGIAERILTPEERALPVQSQAARFAAKEALAKALGSPGGMSWLDAEVVRSEAGEPSFVVTGTVAERLAELGITRIHLSVSHDGGFASATVVCEA